MISKWRKKFAPNGKRMMAFLIGLLVVDLILLAFLTRKPICIESSLLSQMEWVFPDGQTAVTYNCQANIKVPLSKVFIEKLAEIQRRINQFESVLKTNFMPQQPIKLIVHSGAAELIRVSSDTIEVSEEIFLKKDWCLERSYLKSWIQQSQKGHGLGLLRLEVLTDFLMWNLGVRDKTYLQWQMVLGQWPQLATSWSGYCKSSLKDESFASLCMSPSFSKRAEALTPFSMSFWIAQKLWQAFQVLSVTEQIDFFKKIGRFIEALSQSDEVALSEMTLSEMDGFARMEADVWKGAFERVGFREWGWNFAAKINNDLDAHPNCFVRVDLLVQRSGSWTSDELHEFQTLALEEVNYHIMAENDEGLWSFPWLTPIKPDAFPALKAQNLLLITCEWPTVEDILEMQQRSDKVIVVQECSETPSPLIFSGLLHRGLQFFSLDNKDVKFVMLNIEALQFLVGRDESLKKKKLVTKVQTPDNKNYLATKANWSSALWNQKYRAYEVQATIDAVEWFKLPENVWPDFE